jgi:type II secretory pathway pseudopilin PulG
MTPSLSPTHRTSAFSLIEILSVVGLIAILMSLLVPAMNHIQRAGALRAAGNMLVDGVILARETAANRNTFSCLVLTPPDTLPQRLTILEYRPEKSEWQQVTPWAVLPEIIRVADLTTSTVAGAARTSVTQLSPLMLNVVGVPLAGDASMILFQPEAGTGFVGGHRLSARSLNSAEGATPDNFYDVVINPESKAYRVLRP